MKGPFLLRNHLPCLVSAEATFIQLLPRKYCIPYKPLSIIKNEIKKKSKDNNKYTLIMHLPKIESNFTKSKISIFQTLIYGN